MTFLTFSTNAAPKTLTPPHPTHSPITHTQAVPSRRDRFKCHAALPHNTRLTELILPCQDQRPHIVHTLGRSATRFKRLKTWHEYSLFSEVVALKKRKRKEKNTSQKSLIILNKQPVQWIQLLCGTTLSLFQKSTAH